jgi:hypothetical protein
MATVYPIGGEDTRLGRKEKNKNFALILKDSNPSVFFQTTGQDSPE